MSVESACFTWLTPPAPAAIAIVRVPARPALCDRDLPPAGRARFVRFRDAAGTVVDEAVAVRTEDEAMELMIHGGPGIRAAVEAALISHGLFPQPDRLIQENSIHHGGTEARSWKPQRGKGFRHDPSRNACHPPGEPCLPLISARKSFHPPCLRASVVNSSAGLGIIPGQDARWSRLAAAAHPAAVDWLLRHGETTPPFPPRHLVRQPVVLITGPANAGKSTLLNSWCGHQRALVSEVPGTTRDLVAAVTLVAGWRLRLLDSAGLRTTDDALDQAGQALVAGARSIADLVLFLKSPDRSDHQPRSEDLVVHGKADLLPSPPDGLLWSCHGLPGRDPQRLLDLLGLAVLQRLGLPA